MCLFVQPQMGRPHSDLNRNSHVCVAWHGSTMEYYAAVKMAGVIVTCRGRVGVRWHGMGGSRGFWGRGPLSAQGSGEEFQSVITHRAHTGSKHLCSLYPACRLGTDSQRCPRAPGSPGDEVDVLRMPGAKAASHGLGNHGNQ